MSKELLQRVGQFLFGEQWQAPLAREVAVGERSMRRWAAGTDTIPNGVWSDIGLRLETVRGDLDYLIGEVRRTSGLIEVHSFNFWDSGAGEMVRQRAKSTAERITRIGGDVILGTAEWVFPSSVDAEGRMRQEIEATTELSLEDYDLLAELNRRDGLARISHGKQREGAERLVAMDYATSRSLNLSDIEYKITQLGRTALVLKQYGIRSTNFSIESYRFEIDGFWRVRVTGAGAPPLMLDIGSATKLAIHLRAVHSVELAERFERETEMAQRHAGAV